MGSKRVQGHSGGGQEEDAFDEKVQEITYVNRLVTKNARPRDELQHDKEQVLPQDKTTLETSLTEQQAKVIKKLKYVVKSLSQENEALKQNNNNDIYKQKADELEARVSTLQTEKENLTHVIHSLRGCVDQTSLVLERSKARFSRLHGQLSVTRESLTQSQVGRDDVMSINELYQENEEMRNTVSFLRSQLGGDARGRRSPSPSSPSPNVHSIGLLTSDGTGPSEALALENKDLKEKLRVAERKLRAAQTVKRRYEQALERANSILDQRHPSSSAEGGGAPAQNAAGYLVTIRALEEEKSNYRAECMRLAESERVALEECERVHSICGELQSLLDTTTAAFAEKALEQENNSQRVMELEAHLDEAIEEREALRAQVSSLHSNISVLSSQRQPSPPPYRASSPSPLTESDSKHYSELVRKLESQFRNSQHQLESVAAEKQRLEGLYRASQSECAELRNTLSRYEGNNRDLRSQLSDREGRIQALESAKSLLSNAMFKTEQENKQLLWQLKSVQGAEDRLNKTLEQLHHLQAQTTEQAAELTHLRRLQPLEPAHRTLQAEHDRLTEALRVAHADNEQLRTDAQALREALEELSGEHESREDMLDALRTLREENKLVRREAQGLQAQVDGFDHEREVVREEIARLRITCDELASLARGAALMDSPGKS